MPFSRPTPPQIARPAKRIRSTLARLRSPATSQWSRIAPPQRGSGRRVSRKVTTRPVQRGDIAGSWERNAFFPTSVNDETYGRLSDAPALQSLWTFSERQLEFLSAAEAATNIEDSAAARCQLPAVSTQLSVQRSASKISRNLFAKCKEVTEEKLKFIHVLIGRDNSPASGTRGCGSWARGARGLVGVALELGAPQ